MRPTRCAAAALTALAATAVASCSAPTAGGTTPSPAPALTAPGPAGTTGAGTTQAATANLSPRLLSPADLPGPWQPGPAGQVAPPRLLVLPGGPLRSDPDRRDVAQASATGPDGSVLTEELTAYPTPAAAAAAVAQLSATLAAHPAWLLAGDRRVQLRPAATPGPVVHGWHLSVSDAHGAGGADDGVDTPTIEQTYLYAVVDTHLLVIDLAGAAGVGADAVDASARQLWLRAAAKVSGQPVPDPASSPTPSATTVTVPAVAPVLP